MDKCENCEKTIPEDKIYTHLSYCKRNITKC